MNVNCQSCGAKYAIADAKVLGRRVKVRCKSCNTTIVVDGTALAADPGATPENVALDPGTLDGSELSPIAVEAEMWSVSVTDDDQREMTTDQVVAAFKSGAFNDATFVWKEGMADWLPLLDVEPFQALRQPASKPVAAAVPRPAQIAPKAAALPQVPQAAALAAQAAARTQVVPAAIKEAVLPRPRVSNTKDLFSTTSNVEDDIQTAQAPPAVTSDGVTGARNESSVLFSLDALKRQSTAPPAALRNRPNDDPFGLASLGGGGLGGFGGGAGGGLFAPDAHALLTAPSIPPPAPLPFTSVAASGGNLPVFDIAPPPKKGPWLWVGLVAVVLLAGGAFALFGGKESPATSEAPSESTSATPTDTSGEDRARSKAEEEKKAQEATAKAEEEKKAQEATAKAEEEKKAQEAAAKPSGPSSASAAKTTPGIAAAAPGSTPAKATKAKPEAVADSGGGSTFNVAAAKAALAGAAGQAASCKKGGPGGSGKATVTFSPGGSASSVSVTGISGFASNCISGLFKRTRVPAFSGAPVTVSKGFKIPE